MARINEIKTVGLLALIVCVAPNASAWYFPGVSEIVRGGEQILHEGGKVITSVIGGVVRVGEGVVDGTGKIINAAGKEVSIFGQNINSEGNIAISNASREFNKGISDIARNLGKASEDTKATVGKAGKDVEANIAKSGRDIEDAAHAVGTYVERQTQSTISSYEKAITRIREGKFVDAVWHAALDPLNDQQKNMAMAATESSLIRTIGQTAASAYGGPQGAAAYAAWLTYHQTGGDINAAIQVGLITGITAEAFSGLNEHMTANEYTVYQKALVVSTVGAVGVAAAGGSPDDVKNGFLAAGAMVLVQDYYEESTKHELGRDAQKASKDGPPYCTSGFKGVCTPVPDDIVLERGPDGLPTKLDRTKIDIRVDSVGIEGSADRGGEFTKPMEIASKIPGIQGMSVMHDQWVIDYGLQGAQIPTTIIPAIIVFYAGTGAPYYDLQRQTAIEKALRAQIKADAGKAPTDPSEQLTSEQIAAISPVVNEANFTRPDPTSIVDSYVCALPQTANQMVVEEFDIPNPFVCRVLYLNGATQTSKPIWYARHETGYCAKEAAKLSKRLEWLGMKCMQQDGSKKLLAESKVAKARP